MAWTTRFDRAADGDTPVMGGDLDKIDLNIEYMFAAAKSHIPDQADHLSGVAKILYHELQDLDTQAALAGDPAVLRNLLKVGDLTYDALRVGVTSLNNAAAAVLATAQDFVGRDDDARRDFERMNGTLDGVPLTQVNPGPTYVPPDNGNPSQPGAPGPTDEPPTGHPSQGGTSSTPDPIDPEDELPEHDQQQEDEANENPFEDEVE